MPEATTVDAATVAGRPAPRPLSQRVLHQIRRFHLYFGLLLFPWAVLYGVTAFLFNHPSAFPDAVTATYGKTQTAGTPLESWPSPAEQATAVLAALNNRQKPATPYTMGDGEATYSREYIFGTIRSGDRTFSILLDVRDQTGTIRETPTPAPPPVAEKPPFAMGRTAPPRTPPTTAADPLKVDGSIVERFKAAVPTVLQRSGLPAGDLIVTSAPDLKFPVVADGKAWVASYNAHTGTVTGAPPGGPAEPEPSARRFLLRLHSAHGYPGEVNAKWAWALIVDVMAFVLCFWGVSGLLMWWQLKAVRRVGAVLLLVSAAAAAALTVAMYGVRG